MNLGKKTLFISLFALIAVFSFFEYSNADLAIQQYFYLPLEKIWILKDPHSIYQNIFYTGIKIPIYIIGLGALMASVISWKKNIWNDNRKGFLIVTLSLIILPLSIADVFKKVTNVHCPYDILEFGGGIPYVKVLESYPVNTQSADGKWAKGKCWPAGHSSGGFALLSLYCLFRKKKHKNFAFIFAMSMGQIMGIFQVIRGHHFLSHHIITMFLALILVSLLNIFIKDFSDESSPIKK
jgi:membrane-associated PAP2 superfamily phosphatase